MSEIGTIILQSAKSAIELALFILLPIMVVMMALMKLLEAKGVLAFVAKLLSPVLEPLGVPGIGVFAVLQSLLVSFAAPVATLSVMEHDGTSRRRIAATLAMVLTMSQANVVFPLLTVGLNLWVTFATSVVGGAAAATLTYHFFSRAKDLEVEKTANGTMPPQVEGEAESQGVLNSLVNGAKAGVKLVLNSIPILFVAICLVNGLKATGIISFVAGLLSPYLIKIGLSGIAVLPVATKFLAGGTAMMGVIVDLVRDGTMTSLEINRLAGLAINPLDLVGVTVLVSPGPRVRSVMLPAILGAIVGVVIRFVLHLIIFK